MDELKIDPSEYRLGKSKLFVRHPKTLTLIETAKNKKMDMVARLIQRLFINLHTKGLENVEFCFVLMGRKFNWCFLAGNVRHYMNELCKKYPVGSKPSYGLKSPVPAPSRFEEYYSIPALLPACLCVDSLHVPSNFSFFSAGAEV